MTRRLVVALVVAAAALFAAANAHLVYVAVASQPACVQTDPALPPARRSC